MAEEVQNQTHEFPPKQIRLKEIKDDEDRISRLPDSLLVEILSRLLDTKCAVRTSALSKRWKHIWLSVPIFILAHHGNPNADFFSFVDKTLTQRGQLKLKKFSVYSGYNDQFEHQIHNWIRYAINCNVEELDIMFWHINRPDLFPLDQCFYINSYFTDLTLSECHFNPAGAISWKSLLSLHISGVDLDEDLVKNILSGSPVLETLRLEECYGYRRLNITSKSVKKLVIDGYMQGGDVIEINAPNILSLEIQAQLYMRNLLLVNVSSLVEVDLGYKLCGSNIEIISKKVEEKMLKRFILNLKHVKEVKISSYCVKVMSHLENKGFIFPSNLKVCDDENFIDPYESDDDLELSDQFNSDSDESIDSDLLLLDDGPSDDEVQQQ